MISLNFYVKSHNFKSISLPGGYNIIATTVFVQSLSNFTCTFFIIRGGTLLIWGLGVKGQGQLWNSCIKPCGHDIHVTTYCPTTFKLHMQVLDDERSNPIDFGLQGQRSRSTLALCVKKKTLWARYRLKFLPNHFQLYTQIVDDERRNPIDLVLGVKGQGQLWHSCIKPCVHDSDYSFCPITFKLHMQVVGDERRNPFDFGSRGQRSRSTLALCV